MSSPKYRFSLNVDSRGAHPAREDNGATVTSTARAQKAPDTRGPVRKLLTSFGFQILVALVLGIAVGLIGVSLGASGTNPTVLSDTLDRIGSSYVTLLRAAVVPLIFTAPARVCRPAPPTPSAPGGTSSSASSRRTSSGSQ